MSNLMKNKWARNIIALTLLSVLFVPLAGVMALEVGIGEVGDTLELGDRDIRATIASIINVAMGLLGIVAVVIILYGGFTWMTAGGNEENVSKAQKIIVSGIIGLALILASWAIARFVLESLVTATAE
ncbi:pilin [Patescibacteria group bacterium]|nr:pilin [Patescibacteria group bacterium]